MTLADPLEGVPLGRLRSRTSIKWRTYAPDVLPLWVAELDVDLAPPVAEAVTAAVLRGDTGYPTGTAYAEALAGFAERRWGWSGFPVGRSALVPDVMLGLVEALRLVTGPGDPVVLSPPVYPPFATSARQAGREVLDAPLGADGRLDLAALDEAFVRARAGGRRAAYVLCSPHNPTGVVHTAAELGALAALADRHGVRVVADEIHAPLVLPGSTFVPYLAVAPDSDAFALTSASKGWNLAGLRTAVLSAGAGAEADLRRLPEVVVHGAGHLAVIAHVAALEEGGAWLDALLLGLQHRLDLLDVLLAQHLPEARWRRPQASYLAWLDCTRLAAGQQDRPGGDPSVPGAAGWFLDAARVALSAGEAFDSGGAGHVRLNCGTSTQVLTAAVSAMGAAEAAARDGAPRAGAGGPPAR